MSTGQTRTRIPGQRQRKDSKRGRRAKSPLSPKGRQNPNANVISLDVEQPYLDTASAKSLIDGLARIEGHVRSVREMVLDHRCADEILLQVAAVKAALNRVTSQILDHELTACVASCMDGNPDERLGKVTKVISTLLKQT